MNDDPYANRVATWTRVRAYDEVEDRHIEGTVVSGSDRPGPVLVMWDCEDYDGSSMGHEAPEELLGTLEVIDGHVPLQHRTHPLVGVRW